MNIQEQIINEIENKNLLAFTISDFIYLGEYESIKKAMQRLTTNKTIRRITRGIYDKPKFFNKLNMFSSPDINEIAKAIAREYNWNICPSGNYALNLLGISTQVPSKYVYISDGPYKLVKIGSNEICFKHSNKKEISNYSYKTLLVIQALKTLEKDNITDKIRQKIKDNLSDEDTQKLLNEGKTTSIWIFEEIKKIARDKND